jgi:hypothetical protein
MLAAEKKKILGSYNNRPILTWCHSANAFDLLLAVLAEEVKAHAIALRFLDVIVEAVAQYEVLRAGNVTLKHAVLYPLAKVLQDAVDTAAACVVFDVIRHYHVHLLPRDKGGILWDFAFEALRQQACLQLEAPLVGYFIAEDRMVNLGILALLVLHEKFAPRCVGETVHLAQFDAEVVRADNAFIDAGEDDRIDD